MSEPNWMVPDYIKEGPWEQAEDWDGGLGDLEPLGVAELEEDFEDEDEDETLVSLDGKSFTIEIPARLPANSNLPEQGEGLLISYARDLVERLDTDRALEAVEKELDRQSAKYGTQDLPLVPEDGGKQKGYAQLADWYKTDNDYKAVAGGLTWDTILLEELYEALAEAEGSEELDTELIQVAAVAVRIWLAQQRTRVSDQQAIAILRQLMTASAAA